MKYTTFIRIFMVKITGIIVEAYLEVGNVRRNESTNAEAITFLLGPSSTLIVQGILNQRHSQLVHNDNLARVLLKLPLHAQIE
jgi:hypothetical protein